MPWITMFSTQNGKLSRFFIKSNFIFKKIILPDVYLLLCLAKPLLQNLPYVYDIAAEHGVFYQRYSVTQTKTAQDIDLGTSH